MESKITPELIEQAKKAESVAALLALAKENGIGLTAERAEKLFSEWHTTKELSDDELDSVAGGCGEDGPISPCPKCSSYDTSGGDGAGAHLRKCKNCGHEWIWGEEKREYE